MMISPNGWSATIAIWAISAVATAGVILRPFSWPEAIWAVCGVVALLLAGLIGPEIVWTGALKGADVYLFLTGMMLLAETARQGGLFDWLAALATEYAAGSPKKLFLLIYVVGVVVTAVMSNDATAVVLTPAVAAAVKTAKVKNPLPYLLICAFVANAASFVLPISNPANLVLFGARLPPLLDWLPRFALPSIAAVLATYATLRFAMRRELSAETVAADIPIPVLSADGKLAALGIGATATALLAASAFGLPLGAPTLICGLIAAAAALTRKSAAPGLLVRNISWDVLPLVAGLFVLVEALDKTGLIRMIAAVLHAAIQYSSSGAAWGSGLWTAVLCNLVNNLPAGLVAGGVIGALHPPDAVADAMLIGIDLGPNLSVTGSLATILWLSAIRREGLHVGAWRFLKLGFLIMPAALLLALASSIIVSLF